MQYQWKKKEIINKIRILLEIFNQEEKAIEDKPIIVSSIETYYKMLTLIAAKEIQLISEEKNSNNLENFVKTMNSHKKDYPFLFEEEHKDFIEKLSKLKIIDQKKYSKINSKPKELTKEAKLFFQSLNTFMIDNLNEVEKINPHLYHFTKNSDVFGCCFFDFYNKIPYILIRHSKNITDILTTIHEIGHSIEYINSTTNNFKSINTEFLPYLLEMFFYKYNKYYQNDLQNNFLTSYNNVIYFAKDAYKQMNLYERFKGDEKIVEKFNNFSPILSHKLCQNNFEIPFIDVVKYIHSYMNASKVYEVYIDYPKEVLNILINSVKQGDINQYHKYFNQIDINFNDLNIENFQQQQEKLFIKKY